MAMRKRARPTAKEISVKGGRVSVDWGRMLFDRGGGHPIGGHAMAGLSRGGAYAYYLATRAFHVYGQGRFPNVERNLYSRHLYGEQLSCMLRARKAGIPVENIFIDGSDQPAVVFEKVKEHRSGPKNRYIDSVDVLGRKIVSGNIAGLEGKIKRSGNYRVLVWGAGFPVQAYIEKNPHARTNIALQAARILGKLSAEGIIYASIEAEHAGAKNFVVDNHKLKLIDFKVSKSLWNRKIDYSNPKQLCRAFEKNLLALQHFCVDIGLGEKREYHGKYGGFSFNIIQGELRKSVIEAFIGQFPKLNSVKRRQFAGLLENLLSGESHFQRSKRRFEVVEKRYEEQLRQYYQPPKK